MGHPWCLPAAIRQKWNHKTGGSKCVEKWPGIGTFLWYRSWYCIPRQLALILIQWKISGEINYLCLSLRSPIFSIASLWLLFFSHLQMARIALLLFFSTGCNGSLLYIHIFLSVYPSCILLCSFYLFCPTIKYVSPFQNCVHRNFNFSNFKVLKQLQFIISMRLILDGFFLDKHFKDIFRAPVVQLQDNFTSAISVCQFQGVSACRFMHSVSGENLLKWLDRDCAHCISL